MEERERKRWKRGEGKGKKKGRGGGGGRKGRRQGKLTNVSPSTSKGRSGSADCDIWCGVRAQISRPLPIPSTNTREGRGGAEGKIDLVGEGSKGPEFDFVA